VYYTNINQHNKVNKHVDDDDRE